MVTPVSAQPLPPQPSLADRALDVINPLQHLPFVGHLYRSLTGDQITPDARFAGGLLFGGPLGALGAAASMIIGGAVDGVTDGNDPAQTQTALASFSSKTVTAKILDPWKFNA